MELVETIESMPAMVANCCSKGVATAEAIVSGVAPGKLALTTIVGKSTLGRSLTGSNRYAITPKTHKATVTNVVMMGLRMQSSGKFMAALVTCFWRWDRAGGGKRRRRRRSFYFDPRYQTELAIGHDSLPFFDSVDDHTV